jgi:hypothetical protein
MTSLRKALIVARHRGWKFIPVSAAFLVLAASVSGVSNPGQTTSGSLLDPKSPNVNLYMHPPAAKTTATDEGFPELKQNSDGYWQVEFNHLAYIPVLRPPADEGVPVSTRRMHLLRQPDADLQPAPREADPADLIPGQVRQLDGKRVRLGGYMLPVQMENGLVRQFLAIRSPMVCCYGVTPGPNEWVVITMKGKGTVQMMDVPLYFYGTLHVGVIYENKVFEGLYRLDCEKVSVN